jgi:hypothetical protein
MSVRMCAYASGVAGVGVVQHCDARRYLHPEVGQIPHQAAHMLDQLRRQGASVGMKMQRWSQDQKLNSSISHATQRVLVQAIRGSNTQRTVGPAACRPGPP